MVDCLHPKWILDTEVGVELTPEEQKEHPYCFGRKGTCKSCGETKTFFERFGYVADLRKEGGI